MHRVVVPAKDALHARSVREVVVAGDLLEGLARDEQVHDAAQAPEVHCRRRLNEFVRERQRLLRLERTFRVHEKGLDNVGHARSSARLWLDLIPQLLILRVGFSEERRSTAPIDGSRRGLVDGREVGFKLPLLLTARDETSEHLRRHTARRKFGAGAIQQEPLRDLAGELRGCIQVNDFYPALGIGHAKQVQQLEVVVRQAQLVQVCHGLEDLTQHAPHLVLVGALVEVNHLQVSLALMHRGGLKRREEDAKVANKIERVSG